jgi:hypothetical protein
MKKNIFIHLALLQSIRLKPLIVSYDRLTTRMDMCSLCHKRDICNRHWTLSSTLHAFFSSLSCLKFSFELNRMHSCVTSNIRVYIHILHYHDFYFAHNENTVIVICKCRRTSSIFLSLKVVWSVVSVALT